MGETRKKEKSVEKRGVGLSPVGWASKRKNHLDMCCVEKKVGQGLEGLPKKEKKVNLHVVVGRKKSDLQL